MQLPDFEYGQGAIIAPGQQDSFDTCTENLIADARPANFLEQLVVDQLLHAQWELHRVNSLTGNVEAEEALLAASARAQRNWLRATRELTALQTARASKLLCRSAKEAEVPPCADLTKVPKRGAASKAAMEAHCDRIIARAMLDTENEAA